MGLRAQDPVPDWISHIAVVKDKQVLTGPKDEVFALEVLTSKNSQDSELRKVHHHHQQNADRRAVAELKNVSVSYHERKASDLDFHNQH
jgi:hypothetical protein